MDERKILRALARKQRDYAALPVMAEREKAWRAHNGLRGGRPMIVVEEDSFKGELVKPRLADERLRFLEAQMLQNIASHELIGDDKVMPDFIKIPVRLDILLFGLERRRHYAPGGIGYRDEPVIRELDADFESLRPSTFAFDEGATRDLADLAADLIGDILPVKLVNEQNYWHFTPTQHVVNLMGMEGMLLALCDEPEGFARLMRFIVDDCKRFLRWQEANALIMPNGANDYMGGGSYCFTEELPDRMPVRSGETWGHLNAQEAVGVSPAMFREMIYPFYEEMAREFALVYYGCCEPVHPIWDGCLSGLPHLRKISVSAWCDERRMAGALSGGKVIYSRKPSPNFLGVGAALDEGALRAHIEKTAGLTRDCRVEYIFRDVYTLSGNVGKLKKAVEIVRSLY